MGRRTGNPTGRPPTHGHTRNYKPSSEWQSWRSMLRRCSDPKNASYRHYGGRGITVCKRWYKFENFIADMGLKSPRTSLGRIDNNKGYSPKNCEWQTYSEQNRNRRPYREKDVMGYSRCGKKYVADISYKHKKYYIGIFNTAEEARAAYFKARKYYASLEEKHG